VKKIKNRVYINKPRKRDTQDGVEYFFRYDVILNDDNIDYDDDNEKGNEYVDAAGDK
jgi:hypothetical protein